MASASVICRTQLCSVERHSAKRLCKSVEFQVKCKSLQRNIARVNKPAVRYVITIAIPNSCRLHQGLPSGVVATEIGSKREGMHVDDEESASWTIETTTYRN